MNIFFWIILVILLLHLAFEILTEVLNLKNLKTTLPKAFENYYDPEKYAESQHYLRDNTRLNLIENVFSTTLLITLMSTGFFNLVDAFARSFEMSIIPTGLLFCGLLALGHNLAHLPFTIYKTFWIENRYGFNRITINTFIMDWIKQFILVSIIGIAALSGLLWFFQSTGSLAWLYSWVAITLFQGLIMWLGPVLILPLFNKFTPLPDGELKESINDYAKKHGFSLKGISTMDGSKRSNKANAFFTGFGKWRRIVLFDTLVEKFDNLELLSILAHEMGHCKKKHMPKMLFWSILNIGIMLFLLSLFINNQQLFAAFKMESISIYASFFFFGILYSPVQMFLSLITQALSRKHEYEADRYALETLGETEAFKNALKKLSVSHLSNLHPHPLKVATTYSHPPILQRLEAIENYLI